MLDTNRTLKEQAAALPYNKSWEFPRVDIVLVRLIGYSYIGQVWEAQSSRISLFNPTRDIDVSQEPNISNIYRYRSNSSNHFYLSKSFHRQVCPSTCSQSIIIKSLNDKASKEDYNALQTELNIMIHIGRHENLVNIFF